VLSPRDCCLSCAQERSQPLQRNFLASSLATPILLNRLVPLTERVREIRLSWTGWGSGNQRSWTLTYQEETNNSGRRLTRNPSPAKTVLVQTSRSKKLEISRHSRHFCPRPKPALSKTGQTLSNKCRTHSGGFFVPFRQPASGRQHQRSRFD
jgi:hypothetical protein